MTPLHPLARLPLIQAPMAGSQGLRLARAVAATGAVGSLPAGMLDAAALARALGEWAADGTGVLNVNFFCHRPPPDDPPRIARWHARLAPYTAEAGLPAPQGVPRPTRHPFDTAMAEALATAPPPIVSFHFGLPEAALLARVRALGCRVWSSATTVDEARWLLDQGVDALILQGLEAGGHRGHFLREDLDLSAQAGWRDLLAAVRPLAGATPLIAAGGIADAATVREALSAGAAAVQVGTAFLRCPEADTGAVHRAALAAGGETALTNLFSGRPARGLVNRLMREAGPISADAPAFPLASADLAPLRAWAEGQGRGDFSPLWAGTAHALAREEPAAAVVARLLA
ncbi:NAD(P)H-dependent flavin oxidoreductase [Ideonella alba]|uniref:Propionate 3-nitronate monooxygenase n=1 Tax=Ideonella alba TaxID=2824118 RepID=A0A940YH46_9BURK|nr:nitronate monooxygenase [Ideonella alba]MBQ0929834.1 nitronate monooxygenase [Ideonella alba]